MALFAGGGPTTLEQTLGDQANNQVAGVRDQYTQARKKQVAQLAHSGQLMGGTADYPLADLAKEGAGAESDIYSNLANTLAGVSAEDTLNTNDYNRNLQLAQMFGQLGKPSSLQEALGMLSTGGKLAGTAAMFM